MFIQRAEVGISKEKQESEKTRKHAFDQESDQEKKKEKLSTKKAIRKNDNGHEKKKENTHSSKRTTRQKENFSFFLDHFLGRERVFFSFFHFLVFFYKFSRIF